MCSTYSSRCRMLLNDHWIWLSGGVTMGKKQTVPMQLPIAPMQWWVVNQGNNSGGSHSGLDGFAYDFSVASVPFNNLHSKGAPIYAPARGEITEIKDDA